MKLSILKFIVFSRGQSKFFLCFIKINKSLILWVCNKILNNLLICIYRIFDLSLHSIHLFEYVLDIFHIFILYLFKIYINLFECRMIIKYLILNFSYLLLDAFFFIHQILIHFFLLLFKIIVDVLFVIEVLAKFLFHYIQFILVL